MRRVSIVGNTGSGKSTLGRALAARLGVPYVELDAIHHLPGWQPIGRAEFLRRIDAATVGSGWVVDGNYRAGVVEGPVWRRADTVGWLDLPRRDVMRQLTRRTVTREELWNGNRERWSNWLRWDPRRNVLRWAWTRHAEYLDRYESAMRDPNLAHLTFVRLRSRLDIQAWLAAVAPAD